MPLTPGTSLGPYEIVALLGAGGMGEAYRAHDSRLDRDLALKVLPLATIADAAARDRLLREARTASALNHPNICTIYDVGEANGCVYIAMEYVDGSPLSNLIAGAGLPARQVVRYGLQIADAIAHAHERGIVHRDLKCANVVISASERAKVLDFGLSTRVARDLEEATRSRPDAGAIVGTLPYMAPEQLRGMSADARSDVWALGVVLYEMTTGSRPFTGYTAFEVSAAILDAIPPPLPAGIPAGMDTIIARCLEKDPRHRYQHAGEARAALEAIETTLTSDTGARDVRRPETRGGAAGSAHAAYVRGRFFSSISRGRNRDAIEAAIRYFERAIELDPGCAPAHADLGRAYTELSIKSYVSPLETYPKAKAAVLRALELDDGLPEAHLTLAKVSDFFSFDWAQAGREYDIALALGPHSFEILQAYTGHLLLVTRQFDDAIVTAKRAVELDPLNADARVMLAWVYFHSRRHDECNAYLHELLELVPRHPVVHLLLAWNYAVERLPEETEAECHTALDLIGGNDFQALATCAWALGQVGRTLDAERLVEMLEQPLAVRRWLDPSVKALAYAGVGDIDRAIAGFQKGFEEHSPNMVYMNTGVLWDPARGDPRFDALLRRMNFPK